MDSQGYMRPQNIQGFQSGAFADESFDLFTNTPNNDLGWDYNSINNESITQPAASHLNWQQSNTATPDLESYGRPFSKSPSNIQATTSYGYGDPRQFSQSAFDPALVAQSSIGDNSTYVGHASYSQPMQHGTIAPQALQSGQHHYSQPLSNLEGQGYNRSHNSANTDTGPPFQTVPTVNQGALCSAVPKSDPVGIFTIIEPQKLASATNSRSVGPFINVGQQEFEYPINKAIVPAPHRRRSRNELRKLAENDPKLLAKLGKKHHRKLHVISSVGRPQKPTFPTKQWQPTPGIHYEGDSSSSEYSSSDESDDYSEDELAEPSPLPAKRPDTPLEAVKFDAIKATWRSKRFEIDSSEIRVGLKDFWEVVRTIRDRWKTDTAAVTEAEEKKRHGEIPLLKSRVKDQRNMLEAALLAALQHGHKSILELFGENAAFLYLLYQFLLDRFKEDDLDGPLTRAILEILAGCTTLSEENLEKTRLGKVYARFAKKGSTETQALVKRIDANVAEFKKKKAESSVSGPNTNNTVAADSKAGPKSPPSIKTTVEAVAGVKRAAPAGTISSQPPKRVASGLNGLSSPASTTLTAASKIGPSAKRPTSNATVGKPSAAPALTKTKPVLAKPSGSTASAAVVKKPVGAKGAVSSVVANAIKSIEKKAAPPTTVAPSKPAFSFAETMANLTKPKEKEATPKEEDKRPIETPEQKAKRVRKEQRRKLRVTFKPDNQLVEVRLFHHDVEEEHGHDASMIRDVSDVGGEGRMFKQHKDMMEADDEEEAGEEEVRPYAALTLTDFSVVDEEERKRNYAPYAGGVMQPESPERIVREQYEANTLMAYDSPPFPREPSDPYNGEPVVTKSFGAIDSQSIVAIRAARFVKQTLAPQQQTTAATGPDISAILALIKPQQQQQQQQQQQAAPIPTPPSTTTPASNQISGILGILANLPQTQQQQQQQQSIVAQPPQTPVAPNIANILANLQAQGSGIPAFPMQQHQQPPQVSQPQAQPGMMSPPDLAAILGQLGPGQASSAGGPLMGNYPQFGFTSSSSDMQSFGQTQQHSQQQANIPENEERRRWREGAGDDAGSQSRKWAAKKGKDKHYTLPCKYWKIGKCQKGTDCTYLHD